MSISVHSTNTNNPLSGYSYFFGALYKSDVHPVVSTYRESFNTIYQFPSFTAVQDYLNYKTNNYEKGQAMEWLNEICTGNSGEKIAQEKLNMNPLKPGSSPKDSTNQENNEAKTKIWRPFSPPHSSQESNIEGSCSHNRNFKSVNRNTFFSIKPSNVKIGLSKTSVFKAVKKNTFTCSQCSSRYLSNRQLNSHMRVHTGSKPFRCEYPNCFKSFARNEELTRHKRIHSGFKPHICTACKKRFGRKDHLSKHLKTHLQTSEKKVYQCPFSGCGHRYTRSDALTRHKSTAHAMKSQKQYNVQIHKDKSYYK